MFTYMTRFGLWRTAIDLHLEELEVSITSAKAVLNFLMSDEDLDDQLQAPLANVVYDWTEHEHALANYGAVMCQEYTMRSPGLKIRPEAKWFAAQQAEIRKAGWPYSRPTWATDVAVLTGHREKLLKLRPEWYEPKFGVTAGK